MEVEEKREGQHSPESSNGSDTLAPSSLRDFDESTKTRRDSSTSHTSAKPVRKFDILARLRAFETALDHKLGVESEAINRVKAEDKIPLRWHDQAVMAFLWASGVLQISTFATGILGPQFGLSLGQSIPIVICGVMLGAAMTGFCATMGPGTGLRQVSISRYSFGWYPSKIVAVLNVVSQIGWSTIACITGGLALTAVSDGRVSLVVGVIVIAVGSLVISFIGLRAVLSVDKYAWFVFLVLFLVMYGEAASYASLSIPPTVEGANLAGAVLNVLAIVYGSAASWASIASDYYVLYPANTSRLKIFLLTTLGIGIPTCACMVLGCCIGSAMQTRTEWDETYNNLGVGWLIQDILYPVGWAKFTLVILVLAGICNNCMNMYSTALAIQQFARPIAIIPRFFWTLVVFGIVIALSIAGANSLLAVLQNVLAILGYWATSFVVIVFAEHYFFRQGSLDNYNLEAWNDPTRLPIGIAGLSAFLIGFVGWFMGMVTTWYIGPIAKLIGDSGGDIGNQLALVFTLLAYLPIRWMELKYVGR